VRDVGVIHPKGMPVILINPEKVDHELLLIDRRPIFSTVSENGAPR
jgi:hypothetical protein